MFEKKKDALLNSREFSFRVGKAVLTSAILIAASLVVGIVGYMLTEKMELVDALLNASMILSGMGPACTLLTEEGKIFASFYALFSGIVFVTSASVLVAPVFHRILHTFHADVND